MLIAGQLISRRLNSSRRTNVDGFYKTLPVVDINFNMISILGMHIWICKPHFTKFYIFLWFLNKIFLSYEISAHTTKMWCREHKLQCQDYNLYNINVQNDFPCQDKEAPLAYRKNNVMLLCKCNKIIKLTPKHPIITHLH